MPAVRVLCGGMWWCKTSISCIWSGFCSFFQGSVSAVLWLPSPDMPSQDRRVGTISESPRGISIRMPLFR